MTEPVPDSSAQIIYLRSYSERDRDDHDVVGRVLDVTVEMLREAAFADLTTRRIAERAGVPHGELCAYFRSKHAIVAEVYLGLLRDAPLDGRRRPIGPGAGGRPVQPIGDAAGR